MAISSEELRLNSHSRVTPVKNVVKDQRIIKTHYITPCKANNQLESQAKTTQFGLKRKLSQPLKSKGIMHKTTKTGKSPLLRVIVSPSATISKVPFAVKKFNESKDPSDCFCDNDPISDMEVETITSDDERNFSDIEMEDVRNLNSCFRMKSVLIYSRLATAS